MNEVKVNYEEEIDLRELFKIIWEYKKIIFLIVFFITSLSIIYVIERNPVPIYKGKLFIEIGHIQDKNFQPTIIENASDLVYILNLEFDVKAIVPKETKLKIIEIISENENIDKIKEILESAKNYIIEKHKLDTQFYENVIMTKQISDIMIDNEAINKPKKKLIVSVTFITSFILSIFLVFLIDFIKKEARKDKSFFEYE
jgi:capsular polysaccharide biosynthesis protein